MPVRPGVLGRHGRRPAPSALRLVFAPASVTSGVVFATPYAVRLVDASGSNITKSGFTVTATVVTGTCVVANNTAVTDALGIATFTNLTVTGSGECQLRASSPLLTTIDTPTFSVQATPTKVVLTTQPAGAVDNTAFTTQMTGTIQDVNNTVVTQAGIVVTLTPSSGSAIGTTTTTTDPFGGWSFAGSGFGVDVASPPVSVTITASSPGLTSAVSSAVTVSAPGSFGAYEELEALFNAGNIYKYAVANSTIAPMDEVIPLGSTPNSYGHSANGGAWDVVTDPVRGTVTRCLFPAGAPGGASPRDFLGPRTLYAVGTSAAVTSITHNGAGVMTVTTPAAHGFAVGDCYRVTGATQAPYNGLGMVATVPTATTFTSLLNSFDTWMTSPAAGTLTVARVTHPTEIGLGFRVKLSANWTDNGNVGTKLVFIQSGLDNQRNRTSTGGALGQNHYLGLVENQTQLYMRTQLQQSSFATYLPTTAYARDLWVKVQLYWKANSPGASDGKVRVYATPDGGSKTLIVTSDSVPFHTVGQCQGWGQVYFSPTYGGGVNPVPADQAFYLDDLLCVTRIGVLALTTQPTTGTDGQAFTTQPVVQLRDTLGNAIAQGGVTVTASILSGSGNLVGTATALTNTSGVATFTDLGINDSTL